MGYAELIEKLRTLPADKQHQVFDLVEALAAKGGARTGAPEQADWPEDGFAEFSVGQALRDLGDDLVVYTKDDLREHWQ